MNLVFLGSGAFGIPSLEALARSAHRILHIVSQPDRPAGRGNLATPTPVSAWAMAHGVPLTRTENANAPEVLEALRALQPECAVVIAFGQKLSDDFLKLGKHTPINLHSSLLPKYRGAAPINWAVINNDAIAGVCVIEVTAKMDAGAILASAETAIGRSETAGELHDRLAELGSPLLPGVLDGLASGKTERREQESALATRAPKLSREIAWVDFAAPAATVSARIRGLSPWPGVQVELMRKDGKEPVRMTVLKCQVACDSSEHPPAACGTILADLTVACEEGAIELLTVHPANKKAMNLRAFANGNGYEPGARLRSIVERPQ